MKTIGLMSGTSVDGVDAVLCEFGEDNSVRILASRFAAFDDALKQQIHHLCNDPHPADDDISAVDEQLVTRFSFAVNELLDVARMQAEDIDAIGSHGQTIRHCPECDPPYSLQIGDPEALADATGIVTVGDFRAADIDTGGQGAPLAPAFHNAVFRSNDVNRVILNIGGIANITFLPADPDLPVTGFDTGPGNTLVDAWARRALGQDYDADGAWAARGNIIESMLAEMLDEPYFRLPPPKSTGRELFSEDWLERLISGYSKSRPEDIAATLVELTAITITDAISNYAASSSEIYVCGGGSHNSYLMNRIKIKFGERRLSTTQALGIDPDWIEAAAFAWLAKQTLENRPGNLPEVTGANSSVVLGRVCRP